MSQVSEKEFEDMERQKDLRHRVKPDEEIKNDIKEAADKYLKEQNKKKGGD